MYAKKQVYETISEISKAHSKSKIDHHFKEFITLILFFSFFKTLMQPLFESKHHKESDLINKTSEDQKGPF